MAKFRPIWSHWLAPRERKRKKSFLEFAPDDIKLDLDYLLFSDNEKRFNLNRVTRLGDVSLLKSYFNFLLKGSSLKMDRFWAIFCLSIFNYLLSNK